LLVVGANYLFKLITKLIDNTRRHAYLWELGLDVAGNLVNGLSNLTNPNRGNYIGLEYCPIVPKLEPGVLRLLFQAAEEMHIIAEQDF